MRRPASLTVLAAVAAVEAVALLGYAGFLAVEGLLTGATGPEAVSTPQGIVLEVLVFAVFGAGLAAAARGWWQGQRWARSLHVLAQLLILVVAAPSVQSSEPAQRIAGLIGLALAVPSIVLAMTPGVTRAIVPEDERG